MDEENKQNKKILKGIIKKSILVFGLIVVAFTMLVGAIYTIHKEDIEELSKKNNTYNVKVNSQGQTIYVKTVTNESGEEEEIEVTPEEMAEDFNEILYEYIDAENDEERKQKIKYLIQAETVTKTPYIDIVGPVISEELGRIKFYRFDSENNTSQASVSEEYRITYVAPSRFEELKEAYRTSGDETIFKYFTMDDEGSIKIAYGEKIIKKVTTNGDTDLTEDIVREKSGDATYTGKYQQGFISTTYTIDEKPIPYLSFVEQYIMPSNFLYALLIQTRDINFVESIAKLAYESEIAIGIYDNESTSYEEETYTYQKLIDLNTSVELDFSNLQIQNPVISEENLNALTGELIPSRCETSLSQNKHEHVIEYKNAESERSDIENNLYVKDSNDNGITQIGTQDVAKKFTATYRKDITSKSSPTVGVILADTWIAKWTATYNKEDNPSPETRNDGQIENAIIEEYSTKADFVNAFSGDLETDISARLEVHANGVKEKAVNAIYENAKANITFEEITVDNMLENTKIRILIGHIENCDKCKEVLEKKKIEQGDAYTELTKEKGKLKETVVETHYLSSIQAYANTENNRKRIMLENEFKQLIEAEGTITYMQLLEAKKYDINIEFTSKSARSSTTYKKDETIERADDGEKFAEIFNDDEFYDARSAILARESWFWEYIEENEDTEKLESMIRYLFNIATDTTDYITNFDFETMFENLFKNEFTTINASGATGELSVLRQLINFFEGSGEVITIDGVDYYVAYGDALAGNLPTIGHGITNWHDSLFPEEYRGWGVGAQIPVSVVDEVQEQLLKGYLDTVKAQYPKLTSYQAIALASYYYNCNSVLRDTYNDDFNEYIEDKYGEQVDEAEVVSYVRRLESGEDAVQIKQELKDKINCDLYTNVWSEGVGTTGGQENEPGLIKRRYIEWLLFQYGYFYPTNSYYMKASEIQEKIVEIAQNSQKYGITPVRDRCLGWVYDVYEKAGLERGTQGCAFCAGYEYGVSSDFSNIPLGACVYGESPGEVGSAGYNWGHVGIYIGDGKVADNIGYVRIISLEDWTAENKNGCWGWACSTPVDVAYPITKGLIHRHREPCM